MTNKPSSHAKRPGHTLVAVAVLLICALVILPSGCLDNNKDSGADTKAPTAPSNNDKTKVPGPGSTDPGSRPVTTPQDPAKPVVTEPSTVIARPGGSGGGSSGSSGSSSVIELTGIAITQSSPQTVYNGGTLQLSSTLTPNDATYTGRTWYSNNTSVATVDSSGLVTGVADGTAKIYVNSTKNPLINTSIEVTVASKVNVDSVASLNKAISASNVTNITLSGSVNGNVDATRTSATNLSIDFLAYALTGDMQIKADSLLGLNLTGTANPAVTGKLTVSAESATVRNRLKVSGKIDIKAVANHSWIEQAEGNSLSMGDNNGASLILEKSPREVKVTPAARNINITTTVPVEIIIDEGASVSNITASSEAASGTNITNNGMVANISTAANTNITVVNNNNNSNITVDGSGTIGFSGSASGAHNALGTVKVVSDISSDLGLNKTPIYAGDTFNITGVSLNSNESFYVKSADVIIVNVSNSSELNLTAMATGRTSVTVQVKNSTNNDILKQGTIFVTVVPQEISSASVTMTAPVVGASPVVASANDSNYTVTETRWSPELTQGGKFNAATNYTATVTLTSINGKAFQQAQFTPTVTNNSSVTNTTTTGSSSGNRVSFNVTFPQTEALSSNANLSALNVAPDTLVQSFANTTHEYNVTVGKENASINVTATCEHSSATLTINGTSATSGTPSNVTLKDASELTIVPVVVTAEDGSTTKTYNITVSRVVPSMAGTVTIDGSAVYNGTLTANTVGITYNLTCTKNVLTYQWSNGSIIANATNATFVIRAEDIGTNISVNVTADGSNATGSVTSANSSTVTKATPTAAPSAPELWNKTNNTVNLTAITGAEYSYNGTWQDATLFTELTPNTMYSFMARYKANTTHFNSTNSSALSVTTNNTTVNILTIGGVVAPVVGETPVTSITGTVQYTGTVSWTPNHTTFQGNTTYNASIVLSPETNFTLDGLASDSFNVTNATSNTTYVSNSTVVSRFASTTVVEGAAITGLAVPINVLQIGKTITRTAATTEVGASNWSSSNMSVATINSTGVVTAIGAGNAIISYNYSTSGYSNSTLINVYAQAFDNSTNLTISDVIIGGANVTVTGNATLTEGQTTITWVSSNESAATIGETNGTIYALAPGNTTISYNITVDATGAIVEEGSRVITVLAAAPGGLALSKGVEGNTTNVTKLSAGDYECWVNDSAKFPATADDYGNISNITVEVGSIINIRATNPLSANQTLTVEMAHIMNGTAPVDLGLAKPGTGTGTNVTGLVKDTEYQYNVTLDGTVAPAADAIWTDLTAQGNGLDNLDNTVVKNANDVIFIRFKETNKLPASLHTMLIADEHNWKSE